MSDLQKFIEWQETKVDPVIDQYYAEKVSAADPLMGLILSFVRRLIIRGTDPTKLRDTINEHIADQLARNQTQKH